MQEGTLIAAVILDEALSLRWLTWAVAGQAIAGTMSLLSIYNMGNRVLAGPVFGFCSASAWIAFSITNRTWFLLAFTLGAVFLHCVNFRKWSRGGRAP